MKQPSRMGAVTRSITELFVPKKRNITFLTHKDEYYKSYWLNKKLDDGITFIAKVERISKKNAAELMLEKGMAAYMALKVKQYIESEKKPRASGERINRDRFARLLRRHIKEQGGDVSNLV